MMADVASFEIPRRFFFRLLSGTILLSSQRKEELCLRLSAIIGDVFGYMLY
jgi:hypothetical protein